MSFFEFPHTRTYDSDLGWLIKSMKELLDEYNALIAWQAQHKTEYRELNIRVRALENEISSFEAKITSYLTQFEAQIHNEIYSQIQAGLAEFNRQLGIVYQNLSNIESLLARQQLELSERIKASYNMSVNYTDVKIQELIDSLPELTTVNVFNPVRGIITDIQTAVDDLYQLGRAEAITASEYDNLGITASEYDALGLTAIEYDQYGRMLLEEAGYLKNPFHYMNSPFTGENVPLATVISELAALHKLYALTATEYDTKELTASEYDALDLGAYDYDWHGKQLIA